MTRFLLFALTNLGVLLLASLVMKLLGVNPRSMIGLLIFAGLLGFGGAYISLLLSKRMALMSTGARVITQPRDAAERWLLGTVERQAKAAGIGMPDVAIFDAPEMNAFATGSDRNHALVAVSTGLLTKMRPEEVEAVVGHEIGHVANGDMVTMTLLQGVLNTFVVFLSRVVAGVIDNAMRSNRNDDSHHSPGIAYFLIATVLEIVFGLVATAIAMWFSRRREFRADEAGARLSTRPQMIAALQRLKGNHGQTALPDQVEAFGISGGAGTSLLRKLFMSHPPLDERIAALQSAA
jgi:heat shock protein HtpX